MAISAADQAKVADHGRIELTLRSLILGAAITLVFTAANVYLGLKVGLTFASSIPAAVISMAVLRMFKSTSIFENNIVQTVASSAGTLSSIIFVLPGLVMVGWWTGFPFWQSAGVCTVGGILGVMYTIPLRRALVTDSDLPYPEGVAAAEILKVGVGSRADDAEAAAEGKTGLWAVIWGSIASGGFAALSAAKLLAGEVGYYFRFRAGPVATGLNGSLSFALLGAGHLVGLAVGLAILLGLVIAWGVAVPLLTMMAPAAGPAVQVATAVWAHKVRFIGAGAIGAASIWTLGKLILPVWKGIMSSVAASKLRSAPGGATLARTEQDIPITLVGLISLITLAPLTVLLIAFLHGGALQGMTLPLVIGAVAYIVIAGFVVAAVCGFMAGLIGSSNSPVSGLAILAVLGAGLLLVLLAGHAAGPAGKPALVAFALFVTAVLLCVATIANDNLQDLKTGQLVDATPWRQQVALMVGVVMGAIVIPPILDLLNHAYGFGAAVSHAAGAAQPLPAPQATLISALAQGVIEGKLDWTLIGVGVLVGIGLIALDEGLRRFKLMPVPPLAVGLGIYLPASTSSFVVVGAVIGWAYDKWADKLPKAETVKRLGVLLASGLIVGESLFGVLLAGLIVVSGKGEPLALVGEGFAPIAKILGVIVFAAVTAALYRWAARNGRRTA